MHYKSLSLPGVIGLRPEVDIFAEHWVKMTACKADLYMEQRIYRISEVRSVANVPGCFRRAEEEDVDIIAD